MLFSFYTQSFEICTQPNVLYQLGTKYGITFYKIHHKIFLGSITRQNGRYFSIDHKPYYQNNTSNYHYSLIFNPMILTCLRIYPQKFSFAYWFSVSVCRKDITRNHITFVYLPFLIHTCSVVLAAGVF